MCDVLFVMKKSELAAHFIHALGPELVGVVEESMKKVGGPGGKMTVESKVVIRAIQLLEMLLERTPEDKSKKVLGTQAYYVCVCVCARVFVCVHGG